MFRLSRSLFTAGLLLVMLVPMNPVRAEDCCGSGGGCGQSGGCGQNGGCGCKGRLSGLFNHPQPFYPWYAPVPFWFPNYFGPPYTSYQLVHYWTPPDISAQVVRNRIMAINAANPALLPPPKEPLPFPKSDKKLPAEKLPAP